MHFCVSAARVSRAGRAPAHLETSAARSPRKIGTNWFMPAFVKSSPGESGSSDDDGTIVWPCWAKKSRKLWRISAEVMKGKERTANCSEGTRQSFSLTPEERRCNKPKAELARASVLLALRM